MSGIQIKTTGPYSHVFRVWSFKNQYATGLQHSFGLNHQLLQLVKRQMLNDVKTRHDKLRFIGKALQKHECICGLNIKANVYARLEHTIIQVNAQWVETMLLE